MAFFDLDSLPEVEDPRDLSPKVSASPAPAQVVKSWRVVGGTTGGILVRAGRDLKSPQLPERLANGALVEELELQGERIRYQLLHGNGPVTGWVSLKFKNTELLTRETAKFRGASEAAEEIEKAACKAAGDAACKAEEVEEEPADGVLRPPPGGGTPGPHPPARGEKKVDRPEWLLPDGKPEKKNRILFLSMPWEGHIVHLKRLAEWFVEHTEYESHFACLTLKAPDLPKGLKVHCAEEAENTTLFDDMRQSLKELAMKPKDAVWGAMEGLPYEQEETEQSSEKKEAGMGDEGSKVLRFMVRMLVAVKPNAVIADSSFSLNGFLQASCKVFGKASLFFIHSPGIKEKWIEDTKAESPEDTIARFQAQMQQGGAAGGPQAPTSGGSSPMSAMMAQTNAMIPPSFQPIANLPGMQPMRLLQIFMAMAQLHTCPAPLSCYPSSSWMVEKQASTGELFVGPFLPLPKAVNGNVQGGRESLQSCLAPDLLDWLFDKSNLDPIVYIAFGTIVQGLKHLVVRLVEACDNGKWRVLWALPKDMHEWLPEGLSNERWRVESFLPQKDIFRCERVRCFISHCGANSTIEAMSCGVPMVCHPFYMDQYEWAWTVRKHLRAGIQVDKFNSDAAAIRSAVIEVLEEPAYRANAQAVSRRLQDQWAALKRDFGPRMTPKANVGPGVVAVAALILTALKGKDTSAIAKMLQQYQPGSW